MSETLELVPVEQVQSAVQLFSSGGLDAFLDGLETKVRAMEFDVSTSEGRERIRSVAYQIARTKTAVDAEGKRLTEEWRKNTAKVNEERKKSEARLDALKEEVRKPLTDFENKEKLRVAAHEAALAEISGRLVMLEAYPDMSAAKLEDHLNEHLALFADRNWEEFTDKATRIRSEVTAVLNRRIEARKKYDADQAELARLRAEAEKRAQEERDARVAAEAAERQRLESERIAREAAEAEAARVAAEKEAEAKRVQAEKDAEAKRVADEAARVKAEADRLLAEAKERADKIERERLAAEKLAREQAEAAEAAAKRHAQELADAQAQAKRDADAAVQRERDRVRAEQEKQAEADRLAKVAADKLAADKKHRARIISELSEDIIKWIPEGEVGLIDAMIAGKVRHVKVQF
jgi:hypothetical protein